MFLATTAAPVSRLAKYQSFHQKGRRLFLPGHDSVWPAFLCHKHQPRSQDSTISSMPSAAGCTAGTDETPSSAQLKVACARTSGSWSITQELVLNCPPEEDFSPAVFHQFAHPPTLVYVSRICLHSVWKNCFMINSLGTYLFIFCFILYTFKFSFIYFNILTLRCLYRCLLNFLITLDPHYNALQHNADSVITRLRSWIPIFQGLTKAG